MYAWLGVYEPVLAEREAAEGFRAIPWQAPAQQGHKLCVKIRIVYVDMLNILNPKPETPNPRP